MFTIYQIELCIRKPLSSSITTIILIKTILSVLLLRNLENPRKEDAENDLDVSNQKFCSLGLDPITVEKGLLDEVLTVTQKYQHRCDKTKVLPSSFWTKKQADAAAGDASRIEDKVKAM